MIHLIAVAGYVTSHPLSIILSIVSAFVLGFVWHGPLFGKQWMAYSGITPPKKEDMKFSMMLPGIIASTVTVFLQSAVLGRTFQIVALQNLVQALLISTIICVPFTMMVIVNSYAWEGKKVGHMALSGGYNVISQWVIATILYVTL